MANDLPNSEVVFVIEATANMSLYVETIKTNNLFKITIFIYIITFKISFIIPVISSHNLRITVSFNDKIAIIMFAFIY